MKDFISLEEVTLAYFDCRKHKRSKTEALEYEIDYEINNYNLWKDLNNGTYRIGESICFCVDKPKLREIFAAKFRDRIVHHIIVNKMMSLFESEFVDNTYSCRKGRGVFFGVKDLESQIKSIGPNAWYVKLDLSGFFMSIDKDILWSKLEYLMESNKDIFYDNLERWKWIVKIVVFNECEKNCIRRGNLKLWDILPYNKSLFHTNGKGIPIGNLTSQIFANFYLTELDRILNTKVQGYGRYVDDFVLIDTDKSKLKSIIPEIRKLLNNIGLRLNEKKTIIQRCDKGLLFTGYIIKPWGIYSGNRLRRSVLNLKYSDKAFDINRYIRSVNSYLGFTIRTLGFKLRRSVYKNTVDLYNSQVFSREENFSINIINLEFMSFYFTTSKAIRTFKPIKSIGRDKYVLKWFVELSTDFILVVKFIYRGIRKNIAKEMYRSVDEFIKTNFMGFEYNNTKITIDSELLSIVSLYSTTNSFPKRLRVSVDESGLDSYLIFDNLYEFNDFRNELLKTIEDVNKFRDTCKIGVNNILHPN